MRTLVYSDGVNEARASEAPFAAGNRRPSLVELLRPDMIFPEILAVATRRLSRRHPLAVSMVVPLRDTVLVRRLMVSVLRIGDRSAGARAHNQ